MSRLVFRSIMAHDFEEFIKLKRNLGYKYTTEEYVLRAFDTFLVNRGVTDSVLTKDVFDAWMARRQHEAGSTYRERCVVAVQFARYMSDIGKPCFIPRLPKTKVAGFTAHIFTEEEIRKIFSTCDRLILRSLKKNSVIIMLPALIRLLYGTGIRVTEGIMLKDADVNLVENYIILRDTKSRKDRIVPITESLASVCREYKKYRNMLPVIIDREYFFLSLAGRRCANDGIIYTWFRTILREAGIPHNGKHKGRIVPLLEKQTKHLFRYMQEEGLTSSNNEDTTLFSNKSKGKLTRSGISYILSKYVKMAKEECPHLIPENISCHSLRHSKAMHMLQADVPLVYIRDILGHESVVTTEIYAKVDSLKKREVITKAFSPTIEEPNTPIWLKDADLLEWLKSL